MRSRFLAVAFFLTVASVVTFAPGCSDESAQTTRPEMRSPVALRHTAANVDEDATLEFFRTVWEDVFTSRYDETQAWTQVDEEVKQPGVYTGSNHLGEQFTLQLEDATYFTTEQLVTLADDDATAAAVTQIGMTVAMVRGVYAGPAGSVEVAGFVRHFDTPNAPSLGRRHNFVPLDHDDGATPLSVLASVAAPTSFAPLSVRFGANGASVPVLRRADDPSQFVQDCMNNSARPTPPRVRCEAPNKMDKSCLEACRATYDRKAEGALEDACEDLEAAWNGYQTDLEVCNEGGAAGVITGAAACLTITGPGGVAALVIGDLVLAGLYKRCRDRAADSYNDAVDKANNRYNDKLGELGDDYKDCATDCCKPDELTEEEIIEIITGEG